MAYYSKSHKVIETIKRKGTPGMYRGRKVLFPRFSINVARCGLRGVDVLEAPSDDAVTCKRCQALMTKDAQ